MKLCPPPDGSLLPPKHRTFLASALQTLLQHGVRKREVTPLLPQIVNELAQLCSTEDDLRVWSEELSLWVRWYRVPAYWLTLIFQLVTQARKSFYHFLSCDLYSDAQTNFADDFALSSLETAYTGYLRHREVLGESFAPVEIALLSKLRAYHDYYSRWSRPFAYHEGNPCSEHLYSRVSWWWLVDGVADQIKFLDTRDAEALTAVISQCSDRARALYRVLARRFLGLLRATQGHHDQSLEQFELALAEASKLNLDTEIGHLLRLLGRALRATGKAEAAGQLFRQAYNFERQEPFLAYTLYWQALSLRELGDTILRSVGHPADTPLSRAEDVAVMIDDREKLRPALQAYRDGRLLLNGHMTEQSPFPIARAGKQQLFRSFSANAIWIACMLESSPDMLAEVELNGPREATAMVTEIAAARESDEASLADFRSNRALYNETLNTMPARFEDYLANLAEYVDARRDYLQHSFALDKRLIDTQSCDKIVARALELRLQDTIFLQFHLGPAAGTMVLMDMSSGAATPLSVAFGEDHLRAIHEEHAQAVSKAKTSKDRDAKTRPLDQLLMRYADLLNPALVPILRFLPGKHLKIFPRLQMNAVPWHALRLQGNF